MADLDLLRIVPKRTLSRIALIAAIAVVITAVVIAANRHPLPTLADMGIQERPQSFTPIVQRENWAPDKLDPEGFAELTENERFTLLIEPGTSQIAVRSKRDGFLWRGSPPQAKLEKETVKGLPFANLQSPFVLEYVAEGKMQRSVTNALDPQLEKRYIRTERGVQASYKYPELGLSLVIRYELTKDGLEVTVPAEGIEESGDYRIMTLQILPYFGAVSGTEEQGYLFVPDGPGGLIYYDSKRPAAGNRYDYMIYGEDPANLQEKAVPREAIPYPVFGLKRGDQAFAAIVKEGQYTSRIQALPAGMQSSYHMIGAQFVYREEYLRKVSMATAISTVQKDRVRQDRRIEYRLLSGEDADYNGMARTYRDYLLETGQLAEAMQPNSHIPLVLSIVGGGTKEVFGGKQFVTATTFAQAERMISELADQGIAAMRVLYHGWQADGFADSDRRFPIQEKLGGNDGAERFVRDMRERGIPVTFEDFVTWMAADHSDASMKTDGIRSIDTTVLNDRTNKRFLLNPATAVRSAKNTIDRLQRIGVSGIAYEGIGSRLFSDYNPDARLEREDTAYLYAELLRYTKLRLGSAATDRGNDYALGADLLTRFPMEGSYDYVVDETVPFFPMVVHGSVLYTGVEGNLRSMYDKQFLKSIEYGAIPYFKLTFDRSRKLLGTDYEYLFSGEFAVWKDRIVQEYKQFDELANVANRRMIRHDKRSEGVYVTTYDDGTQVEVDYNTNRFEVKKGGGTP